MMIPEIIGVGLSLLMQYTKKKYKFSSAQNKLFVVLLSIICGTTYFLISNNEHALESSGRILTFSTLIWAFLIHKAK